MAYTWTNPTAFSGDFAFATVQQNRQQDAWLNQENANRQYNFQMDTADAQNARQHYLDLANQQQADLTRQDAAAARATEQRKYDWTIQHTTSQDAEQARQFDANLELQQSKLDQVANAAENAGPELVSTIEQSAKQVKDAQAAILKSQADLAKTYVNASKMTADAPQPFFAHWYSLHRTSGTGTTVGNTKGKLDQALWASDVQKFQDEIKAGQLALRDAETAHKTVIAKAYQMGFIPGADHLAFAKTGRKFPMNANIPVVDVVNPAVRAPLVNPVAFAGGVSPGEPTVPLGPPPANPNALRPGLDLGPDAAMDARYQNPTPQALADRSSWVPPVVAASTSKYVEPAIGSPEYQAAVKHYVEVRNRLMQNPLVFYNAASDRFITKIDADLNASSGIETNPYSGKGGVLLHHNSADWAEQGQAARDANAQLDFVRGEVASASPSATMSDYQNNRYKFGSNAPAPPSAPTNGPYPDPAPTEQAYFRVRTEQLQNPEVVWNPRSRMFDPAMRADGGHNQSAIEAANGANAALNAASRTVRLSRRAPAAGYPFAPPPPAPSPSPVVGPDPGMVTLRNRTTGIVKRVAPPLAKQALSRRMANGQPEFEVVQ